MKGLGSILHNQICGRSFTPYFYLQENYGTQEEHPWDIPIELDGIDAMHQRGVFELPGGQIQVDSTSQASVTRISLRLQMGLYVPFMVNRGYVQNAADNETFLAISGFSRSLYPNHSVVQPSTGIGSSSKELRPELAESSQPIAHSYTQSDPTSLRTKLSSMRIRFPHQVGAES